MNAINTFLADILNGINSVVQNFGWSIVVFTVLIKLVLFPLDFKSRKSMRRMSALQPQVAKLQKKYANDKEKLNQKTAELYRKERINPLSGCLPMLISLPVLFAMFAAMRMVANTALAQQVIALLLPPHTQMNEGWLWVRNLWMPDSPFSSFIADPNSLKQITADIWTQVFSKLTPDQVSGLAALNITSTFDSTALITALQQSPAYASAMAQWAAMPTMDLLFTKLTIYASNNGFFILPVLAAVTQYLMTLTQPTTPTTSVDGAGNPAAGTGKFMKWFFPIFSLYICSSYNAGFSIYWVMANLISWGQGLVLNRIFEAQEKNKQAVEAVGEESLK